MSLSIFFDKILGVFREGDSIYVNNFNTLENLLGNGVLEGLTLSINSLDNTKFDISVGIARHTDNTTNVEVPVVTKITYSGSTENSPNYLNTNKTSYIAINKTGVIVQKSSPFTFAERRDYIILGLVIHSNLTIINVVNNLPDVAIDTQSQVNDLMDGINNFNISGNIYKPNGANLKIDKTEGSIFKRGVNFSIDNKNPHSKLVSSQTAITTIRYRLADGTEYADRDTIDLYYDNAGVKTAIPVNEFSIQRIYLFPSGLTRIQYGIATYKTIAAAIQGLSSELFIPEDNIAQNGLRRGFIIVNGSATNASNTDQCIFIEADKFGGIAGGTGSGTTSLQQAYINSGIPNITTNATQGALSIKSHTNDASSNLVEYYDSDGNLIEKLDSDGFYSIRYRDEYVSDDWVNAGGAKAPDIVTVTIGGITHNVMSFDGGTTEEVRSNSFEVAHDLPIVLINNGTLKIELHGHGSASNNTAGTAKFFFDWCYCPKDAAPIPMTTVGFDFVLALNGQYWHRIAGVELPIPTGGYQIGDIIKFNIRRTPNTTGDDYNSDFLLYKVALHVPSDGNGSRQRYIK